MQTELSVEAAPLEAAGKTPSNQASSNTSSNKRPLHRIREVREEQGVSIRSVSRALRVEAGKLKVQERESSDLTLSQLYAWQRVLDVPVEDLLVEPDTSLSRPVMERARMIRLMRTAMTIREKADSVGLRRMAQTMVEQLVEIMPELAEVSAWHSVGQRRTLDEYGRIFERRVPDDLMGLSRGLD